MNKSEIVYSQELIKIINQAVQCSIPCQMSYISRGKWHRTGVKILDLNNKSLTLHIGNNPGAAFIQIAQPVSITFELKRQKCILESEIIGLDATVSQGMSGKIMIERPVSIEKMRRRAYERVSIPPEMNVEALFWHRGYADNSTESPLENCWQGQLIDLSAGGTQVKVDKTQHANFREGQIIGIRFTPLPYEKQLLLEGRIKHIAGLNDDNDTITLGIEFMGLEASADGRNKMERLMAAVNVYKEKSNKSARTQDGRLYAAFLSTI
mgnify:CR=1 FL=1